jgi:hypothetical protein
MYFRGRVLAQHVSSPGFDPQHYAKKKKKKKWGGKAE